MTVADLVDVLEHMRFAGGQATTVRIDRGVPRPDWMLIGVPQPAFWGVYS